MSKSQNHLFALPAADLAHILRLASPDLEALRGKNLFITGGTGFFGKWLLGGLHHANEELDLGVKITVLSRDPSKFLSRYPEATGHFSFVPGDLAELNYSLATMRFDYIIHGGTDTIAFTTEAEESQRSYAILWGTQQMLELMNTSHAHRMLNISSGAVYGPAAGKPGGAGETDSQLDGPRTPYGKAKLEAEQMGVVSGLDVVTARAFAFLGPHLPLDAHFAAGNFLRDAMRGGPIEVRGDGTALRSYLHPADLVVWLLRILVQGHRGQAYNVGSNEAVTTSQLARLIANSVQPKAELVIQSRQPQGAQNIYLPNIARARDELHLDVAIPLPDAIARTLGWLTSSA